MSIYIYNHIHTHTHAHIVAYSKTILTAIAMNIFSLQLTGDLQDVSTGLQASTYYITMPYQNSSNYIYAIY